MEKRSEMQERKAQLHRNDPYSDMIELPHPVSSIHPPMPLKNRAAQFAPFAALVGFHEAIERTAREWENERTARE